MQAQEGRQHMLMLFPLKGRNPVFSWRTIYLLFKQSQQLQYHCFFSFPPRILNQFVLKCCCKIGLKPLVRWTVSLQTHSTFQGYVSCFLLSIHKNVFLFCNPLILRKWQTLWAEQNSPHSKQKSLPAVRWKQLFFHFIIGITRWHSLLRVLPPGSGLFSWSVLPLKVEII